MLPCYCRPDVSEWKDGSTLMTYVNGKLFQSLLYAMGMKEFDLGFAVVEDMHPQSINTSVSGS